MANDGKPIGGYVPKMYLAIIGLACFLTVGILLFIRFFRNGMRKYMLPVTIGACCMAVGFGVRIVQVHNSSSLGVYIGQTLFILLSPCAFLAQDYMLLPRLAEWLQASDLLFLSPRLIVRIFVISDVSTFFIQASGGGMSAMGGSTANVGEKISLVGLILQGVSFGLFTVLLISFGLRVRKNTASKWSSVAEYQAHPYDSVGQRHSTTGPKWSQDWRVLYWMLLLTCVGFLTRSMYRIVEFSQGYNGYLVTHEGYFYLLDSLPLLCSISLFVVVWPPCILNRDSPYLTNDMVLAAKAQPLMSDGSWTTSAA